MKLQHAVKECFGLIISPDELACLASSIAQVCGGMATPKVDEYRYKIGAEIEFVRGMRDRLLTILSDQQQNNPSETSLNLSLAHSEVRTIVGALSEVANGDSILDWEFETLVGFEREYVRQLLSSLHRVLVNRGKDLRKLVLVQSL
jgi:hypothetical protein